MGMVLTPSEGMMIKRPTWILLIVLAALAALAYYLQTVPDNFLKKAMDAGKTPTVETATKSLIPSADGLVTGLEIAGADGHSIALKKESAGWTLSIDAQTAISADQSAAEQAASQLQGLQVNTEITPTTSDLLGFGLDKPAYTWKVTLQNGKTLTFKIGKANITGDGYYLQRADKTIVIVDKYTTDALLNLLTQPPAMFTATPLPPTALPTGTITPTPTVTITPTSTATSGS